jgi:hypothetical protein
MSVRNALKLYPAMFRIVFYNRRNAPVCNEAFECVWRGKNTATNISEFWEYDASAFLYVTLAETAEQYLAFVYHVFA